MIYHHHDVDNILKLNDCYITKNCNPDKSLDILDEVSAKITNYNYSNEVKLQKYKLNLKNLKQEKNNYILTNNYEKAIELKNKELEIENRINHYYFKKKLTKPIIIEEQDILDVIYTKMHMPSSLKNISQFSCILKKLNKNIINQEETINKLCSTTYKKYSTFIIMSLERFFSNFRTLSPSMISMSGTPFFSLSASNNSRQVFHNFSVASVGFSKKLESPS